jgi:CO/xanthine dehydrogenase Mo-binding subunit
VLTGTTLRGFHPYYGPAYRDRPVLAIDRVRYEGEPVAAVAAVDEATANAALDLIEVEYDALPDSITIDDALAPGAALVHEDLQPAGHFKDLASLRPVPGTNICHHVQYARGDAATALAGADLIVEGTYTFPKVQHVSMEAHVAIARWEPDQITVWSATQNPYSVRSELAILFGMPMNRIRLIVPYLGGGFGAKTYAKMEPIAIALSRLVGRPVKVAASIQDAFKIVRRCEAKVRMRIGLRRDGVLEGIEVDAYYNLGAYADIGPRVVQKGVYTATGPYRFPAFRINGYAVYTNTTPGGAFRGFGVPQLVWAMESLLDDAARRLQSDPVDLRRRNLLRKGDEFAPGDRPIDGDYEESLRLAAAGIGWQDPPPARGARGLAMMLKASLAPSVSEAVVRLNADGSATVLASTVEMGQGARTVLAQIAAESLGLPLERVSVALPDTAVTPYDQTTSSSRSTTLVGLATQRAAADVRQQLVAIGAALFEAPEEVVRVENGEVRAGPRRMTVADAMTQHFGMPGGELIGVGSYIAGRSPAPLGGSTPFWETAVGAAEVTVDEETGEIDVRRYVSVADVGRAINPLLCQAQDEGAVIQGLGHTLFEEIVYQDGQMLNPNLVDYRVPVMGDLPGELRTIFVENADGSGPFGAKGIGEGGLIPVGPAISNAVAAQVGVHLTELPISPERVWRALQARRAQPAGSAAP